MTESTSIQLVNNEKKTRNTLAPLNDDQESRMKKAHQEPWHGRNEMRSMAPSEEDEWSDSREIIRDNRKGNQSGWTPEEI